MSKHRAKAKKTMPLRSRPGNNGIARRGEIMRAHEIHKKARCRDCNGKEKNIDPHGRCTKCAERAERAKQ